MSISDSEIIESIRKGAKREFARLIDRYKDKGMTLAMRMLKHREDAEEALQDAFIRAYNALDKFEGAAKFGTWFYRILYNVCLTKLSGRKEEYQSIEYEDENSYDAIDPMAVTAADSDYEQKEIIAQMKLIIVAMPEKYRTLLSLFYFQELNHQEICDVTKLPLGTIKTQLFRARVILRQKLLKELQQESVQI